MRAPCALPCRPAPSIITPARISSSLNLPISERSSVVGITPASLSGVAFTITMNRMTWLLLVRAPDVVDLEDAANLDCGTRPLQHLCRGGGLHHPIAGDQLARRGVRAPARAPGLPPELEQHRDAHRRSSL